MLHKYNTTTEAADRRVFLSIAAERYYKFGLGVAEFLAVMTKAGYHDDAIFAAFDEAVGRAK